MEAEFVNAYLNRQKAYMEDLLSKFLLSEAKIAVLEKRVSDLSSQLEQAQHKETQSKKS